MIYVHGNQCIISTAQKADTLMIWSSFHSNILSWVSEDEVWFERWSTNKIKATTKLLYWLFVAIVSAELPYKTKCINAFNPTLHPTEVVNMMGQVCGKMLRYRFILSCIPHWRCSHLLRLIYHGHVLAYAFHILHFYTALCLIPHLLFFLFDSVVYVVSHAWSSMLFYPY